MHRANALPSATCDADTRIMLRISNQGVNPDIPNLYTEGVHFNAHPSKYLPDTTSTSSTATETSAATTTAPVVPAARL